MGLGGRKCESCGYAMPAFMPRRRHPETGELVCNGCHPDGKGSPHMPQHMSGIKTAILTDDRWGDLTPISESEGGGWIDESGRIHGKCTECGAPTPAGDEDYCGGNECQHITGHTHEALRRVAHDSGDGATVFHCPFCFAEDVRYVTREGIKSFGETVGTTQWVLTADENDRTGGRWVEAHIHEFGEQSILRVTMQRNQQIKVVDATPEHRWLVKADRERREPTKSRISLKGKPRGTRSTHCGRGHELVGDNVRIKKNGQRDCNVCAKLAKPVGGLSRATNRDVLTKDIKIGMRLSSLRASGVGDLVPSEDGIRHGVVFGDGSAQGKYANVTLWGEKDKQLLRYFPDRNYTEDNTAKHSVLGTGVLGIKVTGDLWSWMKAAPEIDADPAYLYGWLAGYFAADGTVGKQGGAIISSANIGHLEAVRDIALRLGIATYGITMQMRVGFEDREPSPLFDMEFVGSTLNEDFFLVEEHRDRYRFRDYAYERFGWTVVSVEDTGRIEKVYCAVVPETHSFALEDHVWVGNCGGGNVIARSDGTTECGYCQAAFTVQVQPMYPNMPQTDPATGLPIPQPGMPGQPGTPGDVSPEMQPDATVFEPPDATAPAFTPPEQVPAVAPVPAVAASKAKPFYVTSKGMALDEDAFIRHLAIQHADDREKVIEQVRQSRV